MTNEEKVDFLISCAEDLEKDHNLEIWGAEDLQECADAFRDGAEALRGRKTGKWILVPKHSIDGEHPSYDNLKCSCCGSMDGRYSFDLKHCPNCGAKMEVDE